MRCVAKAGISKTRRSVLGLHDPPRHNPSSGVGTVRHPIAKHETPKSRLFLSPILEIQSGRDPPTPLPNVHGLAATVVKQSKVKLSRSALCLEWCHCGRRWARAASHGGFTIAINLIRLQPRFRAKPALGTTTDQVGRCAPSDPPLSIGEFTSGRRPGRGAAAVDGRFAPVRRQVSATEIFWNLAAVRARRSPSQRRPA
jgi:hypothetical protein